MSDKQDENKTGNSPIEDKLKQRLQDEINRHSKQCIKNVKLRAENEQLKKSYALAIKAVSQSNTVMIKMSGVENDLRAENERLKTQAQLGVDALEEGTKLILKISAKLEKAKGAFSEIYKKAILIRQLNDILDREEMVEQALQIQKIAEGHK